MNWQIERLARNRHVFPTRQFPYRKLPQARIATFAKPPEFELPPGRICRFIFGRDSTPREMTPQETAQHLNDPFAASLLRRGVLPLTTRQLLGEIDKLNGTPLALPNQKVFLVADGGQIPWSQQTADLNRQFRFAIIRMRTGNADILISSSSVFDSEEIFLQVFSWDDVSGAFNFYERRSGSWCWAGSSWDALEPDTRGNGPFDSHVNGGPVMKELRAPWMHWHSQAAMIPDDALAPGDPLRSEHLYLKRAGAEQLEQQVISCLHRWTQSRFSKRSTGEALNRAPEFFRQVMTTTTVNIATSPVASRSLDDDSFFDLPRSFFLNTEALFSIAGLPMSIPPLKAPAKHYLACIQKYDVTLHDEQFTIKGDTHFAFSIPEPAKEDLIVTKELAVRKIISPKCLSAILMVDYPNPVYSQKRAALLAHVPDRVPQTGDNGFDSVFVPAVRAVVSTTKHDSAEREFLTWYDLADDKWQEAAVLALKSYLNAVIQALDTSEGFDSFFRLAESRRREFRRHPLAEFRLTTPTTNIPENAPLLMMTTNATVSGK